MGAHPVRRQRADHRAPRGAAARPLPDDRLAVPRAQHLGADAVRHAARAARQGAARGSWLLGPNPNPNPNPDPNPNPSQASAAIFGAPQLSRKERRTSEEHFLLRHFAGDQTHP